MSFDPGKVAGEAVNTITRTKKKKKHRPPAKPIKPAEIRLDNGARSMIYRLATRQPENKACAACGVNPGQQHDKGCDWALCRSSGMQFIWCPGQIHEFGGREYGEHEGVCEPNVHDGEYPGTKLAREMGWFTLERNVSSTDGWNESGLIAPDLNRLWEEVFIGVLVRWDPEKGQPVRVE